MRLIVAAGALGAIVGALVGIAWALDREEAPGLADACMLALDHHATLGEAAEWCGIAFDGEAALWDRKRAMCRLGELERLRGDFLGELAAVYAMCAARYPGEL